MTKVTEANPFWPSGSRQKSSFHAYMAVAMSGRGHAENRFVVSRRFTELVVPVRRNIRTVQRGNAGTPEQPEGSLHISPQNFQRACDARLPGCRQSVGVSSPNEHGSGSQANGFDDIAAATNAAIHQHLDSPVHRAHHFRQHSQSCWSAVKLASAMIGNNDCYSAFIHRSPRIISRKNAFDHDRTGPTFSDPH